MQENTGFSIINLRDGGEIRLLFPEEIGTDDRTNWEAIDVAGGVKPLSFANCEPRQITINDLCVDHTRTNASVKPIIDDLESWMRPDDKNGAPPALQIVTVEFQKRVVLSSLNVKRTFHTKEGVCIRAYLTMSFDELPASGLQMDVTTRRRSNNSLSGNTYR